MSQPDIQTDIGLFELNLGPPEPRTSYTVRTNTYNVAKSEVISVHVLNLICATTVIFLYDADFYR